MERERETDGEGEGDREGEKEKEGRGKAGEPTLLPLIHSCVTDIIEARISPIDLLWQSTTSRLERRLRFVAGYCLQKPWPLIAGSKSRLQKRGDGGGGGRRR